MKTPYGYIYRIRNKINGKTYVGQRKLSLDRYWRQYLGSGKAVKAAISKHGADSFVKELIAYAFTHDELNKMEVDFILAERSKGKAEYNLHIGSPVPQNSGGFKNLSTEEIKEVYKKLAAKNKARHRRNYEEIINPYKETILSLYAKDKSCKKVADKLGLSVKHVNQFLKENGVELNHQTVTGRIMTDDVKKRISEGLKKSEFHFTLTCAVCGLSFTSRFAIQKKCVECKPKHSTSSRIKKGVSSTIITLCSQCNTEFEHISKNRPKYCSHKCATDANRKELPPIEVIEKLYWEEKMSANEIGKQFSVSGQTIRNYMRKHDVSRREERHQAK